jgi:hypothetical protein
VGTSSASGREQFLIGENVYYNTVSRGFISLGEFIPSADLFKEVSESWKDLAYPNLKNTDGS